MLLSISLQQKEIFLSIFQDAQNTWKTNLYIEHSQCLLDYIRESGVNCRLPSMGNAGFGTFTVDLITARNSCDFLHRLKVKIYWAGIKMLLTYLPYVPSQAALQVLLLDTIHAYHEQLASYYWITALPVRLSGSQILPSSLFRPPS
jgi:hypothetical protein